MFGYFIGRNFDVVDPATGRAYVDDYYARLVEATTVTEVTPIEPTVEP